MSQQNQIKDIFIDCCSARVFCNPLDACFVELLCWIELEGHLTLSQHIISEYSRSFGNCKGHNLLIVIADLTKKGRINPIKNDQIKEFTSSIKKHIKAKLKSNAEDLPNLATVLLSERRIALSQDNNFINDVNSFPGVSGIAHNRPEKLPYK